MKILNIRKQWDEPNHYGDNRFEIEFERDGELYYAGFIAFDEVEAYQIALRQLNQNHDET
jgi:hypothetical protein